jgi:hypothetical protein
MRSVLCFICVSPGCGESLTLRRLAVDGSCTANLTDPATAAAGGKIPPTYTAFLKQDGNRSTTPAGALSGIAAPLARCRIMHHVRPLARFSTKALAQQIGDIGFVVHDQDTYTHDAACAGVAR